MLRTTAPIQDVLKHVYLLRLRGSKATNLALADASGVTPGTVSKMLKKAARERYLIYEPYREVRLTGAGEREALEVIRHHRLIELFLVEKLGFDWHEVHSEAEHLEHFISEKLERKLAQSIGRIDADPHGHPIPTEDGRLTHHTSDRLLDRTVGEELTVIEVMDHDPEALKYLGSNGIHLKTNVKIIEKGPFEGSLKVEVDSTIIEISPKLASLIYVTARKPRN